MKQNENPLRILLLKKRKNIMRQLLVSATILHSNVAQRSVLDSLHLLTSDFANSQTSCHHCLNLFVPTPASPLQS